MTKLITVLTALLLAAPLAAQAQQTGKVWRIGYLRATPVSSTPHLTETFLQGLRELGYVEGRNVVIEFRDAGGKLERLPLLASELVRLKVDVLVTSGTDAAFAAKQATSVIPIVMTVVADAVGTGLVTTVARPGGNVTGLTFISPELAGKRLALLKEAFPKTSRVAILWNPDALHTGLEYKETQSAAKTLGLTLHSAEVRGPNALGAAFSSILQARSDALIVFTDSISAASRERIAELAATSRLPTIYGVREYADAGGLMSYGPNLSDLYRRASIYVDKILKGAKPADLPVEQPTKFEFVINLKTAKAIGLTIPLSLVLRADHVIQ